MTKDVSINMFTRCQKNETFSHTTLHHIEHDILLRQIELQNIIITSILFSVKEDLRQVNLNPDLIWNVKIHIIGINEKFNSCHSFSKK